MLICSFDCYNITCPTQLLCYYSLLAEYWYFFLYIWYMYQYPHSLLHRVPLSIEHPQYENCHPKHKVQPYFQMTISLCLQQQLLCIQVMLTVIIMWGICGILTLTEYLPEEHPARTDLKLKIVEDSPWFRIPYPGKRSWQKQHRNYVMVKQHRN